MTIVVRDSQGVIQYFADRSDGLALLPGQKVEQVPVSFADFASRLVLSVDGLSGQTIVVKAGAGQVIVQVSCALLPSEVPVSSVALDINGSVETVQLVNGAGRLTLSCQVPGVFLIRPADRILFPAAGSSLLAVVVEK